MTSAVFVFIVILGHCVLEDSQATCTFPVDVRAMWVKGDEPRTLTFASSSLTGMNITWSTTTDLDTFDCYFSSGSVYVINASYTGVVDETVNYFVCWELQKVTASAYLMFDLTAILTATGFDQGRTGVIQNIDDPFNMSAICTKNSASELPTTLVKNGATSADVSVTCPRDLITWFSYGLCASTELSFCSNNQTATANYSMCSTRVFNSANGVLVCMGDVTRASFVYLNLFQTDARKVTCFRFPSSAGTTFTGTYYSGDCTKVKGTFTDLTFTQIRPCFTTTTSTTTTTTTTTVSSSSTTTTSTTPTTSITTSAATGTTKTDVSSAETSRDSGTDSKVGVAVGVSLGLVALAALGLLMFLVFVRKIKFGGKISDSTRTTSDKPANQNTGSTEKSDENEKEKNDDKSKKEEMKESEKPESKVNGSNGHSVTNGNGQLSPRKPTSLPPIRNTKPVAPPVNS
ncbi:serine-rich adhesin for platelets-like [Physella acuta]|uniref:serine-rich adhesin for platelets-like n=1 Tax=Physella acuta TaxID=109671 RepID=UPI0027DCC3EF|nr:serine-rich adhesin for platelets-like [Physella acuta]